MKTDIRRRNILRGMAIASAAPGGVLGVSATPPLQAIASRQEQLSYHLRQIKEIMNDLVETDSRWFVSVAGMPGTNCTARATRFDRVPREGSPCQMTERTTHITDADL